MEVDIIGKLIESSPMAAVAAVSIFVMYKLVLRWMDHIENVEREVLSSLVEITVALKHLNGKEG